MYWLSYSQTHRSSYQSWSSQRTRETDRTCSIVIAIGQSTLINQKSNTYSSEFSNILARFSYRSNSFRIVPVFRATSSFSYLIKWSALRSRTQSRQSTTDGSAEQTSRSPSQNQVDQILVPTDVVNCRTSVTDLSSKEKVEDLRCVLLGLEKRN
jgi:hypothetical protein